MYSCVLLMMGGGTARNMYSLLEINNQKYLHTVCNKKNHNNDARISDIKNIRKVAQIFGDELHNLACFVLRVLFLMGGGGKFARITRKIKTINLPHLANICRK